MPLRTIIPPKLATGGIEPQWDFTGDLLAGETVSSAVVTATVYAGTDPTPSAIVSGAATVSGNVVTQLIINGVLGVIYQLLCAATTSSARTINQIALLAIVPGAP